MDIFGVDITLIPWPMFLLLVFVIFSLFWYLHIHVPIVDELEATKEILTNEIKSLTEATEKLKSILDVIQKDQNGISNRIHERFSKLETINLDLSRLNDTEFKKIASDLKSINDDTISINNKIKELNESVFKVFNQATVTK